MIVEMAGRAKRKPELQGNLINENRRHLHIQTGYVYLPLQGTDFRGKKKVRKMGDVLSNDVTL